MSSDLSPSPVIELIDADIATMQDPTSLMFNEVNWSVMPGEFWALTGAELSGKTDFLLLTAGLMPPMEGSCKLFGVETRTFGEAELPMRLQVGYVYEGGPLFNSLTIAENMALPLRYQKNLSIESVAAPLAKLVELLELEPFADLMPVNVPAAWRYRAALARALILEPQVLLLDNPLAGMVAKHRQWLVQFLDQLWQGHEWFDGQPITVVVSTDDLHPWQNHQRKFALLEDQKFIPLGHWKDVEASTHPTVKELLTMASPVFNPKI